MMRTGFRSTTSWIMPSSCARPGRFQNGTRSQKACWRGTIEAGKMARPMPTEMTFNSWFAAQHPTIPIGSALAVLRLAEEGGTVPFIARYRKEQTGNLDEVAIRHAIDGKAMW